MKVERQCKCGCGTVVPQAAGAGRPRVWVDNHRPGRTQAGERTCACGCGELVVRLGTRGSLPRFVVGHAPSARKVKVVVTETADV